MQDILNTIAQGERPIALAVIIQQVGASYRPLGATMAVLEGGRHVGHISAGCIEADIITRANDLHEPQVFRYGAGSPYMDLKLPCGGTLDVLILPDPQVGAIYLAADALARRAPVGLCVNTKSGEIAPSDALKTVLNGDIFHWHLVPELKFMVFGNGYEATQFAELALGAGYWAKLHSTNAELLSATGLPPENKVVLPHHRIPDLTEIDAWTAVLLFFHEHDLEDGILQDALKTSAFYIGAQGSMTAQIQRIGRLKEAGATEEDIARCRGPIGLIPHVRDPKTLAVSVLAEILSLHLTESN